MRTVVYLYYTTRNYFIISLMVFGYTYTVLPMYLAHIFNSACAYKKKLKK